LAHSLSANKRIRQSAKRRLVNRDRKRNVRVKVRELDAAISKKDLQAAQKSLPDVVRTLDRVSGKGTIHKKTAARKKSRLMKKINALAKASAAS
jgi:small subunit ribosomal protein S20